MKRISSIFLACLLLFNALGFYGFLQGMRYKATLDLVKRLDKNEYSADETVTLKVPISVPYQMNSEYERVDGEFAHEGQFYRFVKQKFESDTLYIVCVKDRASSHIQEALTDYVKTLTDNPGHHGKSTSKNVFTCIKDFLPSSLKISIISEGWNCSLNKQSYIDSILSRSIVVFTPPPQA